MALIFRRYFDEKYTHENETLTFKLKHLTPFEVRSIRSQVSRVLGLVEETQALAGSDLGPAEVARKISEAIKSINEALPEEFTRGVFEKYVKDVAGLVDEDGKPLTAGLDLHDAGDEGLHLFVLMRLLGNGKVSAEEGKDSGSPSESASEKATSVSVSAVPSIESAAGASPSTATVTIEREPSGVQDPNPAR